MREGAVTMTFRRIGRFFNKVGKGSFSFPLMISGSLSFDNSADRCPMITIECWFMAHLRMLAAATDLAEDVTGAGSSQRLNCFPQCPASPSSPASVRHRQ